MIFKAEQLFAFKDIYIMKIYMCKKSYGNIEIYHCVPWYFDFDMQ